MFKFPEGTNHIHNNLFSDDTRFALLFYSLLEKIGSEVHLQCDVQQCNGGCAEEVCPGDTLTASLNKGGRKSDPDSMLLAATTVFVLDPSEAPRKWEFEFILAHFIVHGLFSTHRMIFFPNSFIELSAICEDSGIRPPWLLWLAITLGVLFLIMLLMNIFLCTAMSCSCARTEVNQFYWNLKSIHNSIMNHYQLLQIIEKEPSIIEEYDPYRSWHGGSQYGSRYSLHGRESHNKGYTSGGSTIHSNRSDRF